MKIICIAGRLGKDAVTRTVNDTTATNFSVAVDDGWGDKKSTVWFDCSMWGLRGEKVAQYLTKGTPVSLSGDLGTREYEGKIYLTIRVADLTLQGSRDDTRQPDAPANPPAQRVADDEIPFMYEWRG